MKESRFKSIEFAQSSFVIFSRGADGGPPAL
jgi:hypothetical protein